MKSILFKSILITYLSLIMTLRTTHNPELNRKVGLTANVTRKTSNSTNSTSHNQTVRSSNQTNHTNSTNSTSHSQTVRSSNQTNHTNSTISTSHSQTVRSSNQTNHTNSTNFTSHNQIVRPSNQTNHTNNSNQTNLKPITYNNKTNNTNITEPTCDNYTKIYEKIDVYNKNYQCLEGEIWDKYSGKCVSKNCNLTDYLNINYTYVNNVMIPINSTNPEIVSKLEKYPYSRKLKNLN